jgi:glutathione synthase/RimK-type ligase-like ATP-grasp enzyme
VAELARCSAGCFRWNVEDFPLLSQLHWRPESIGGIRVRGRAFSFDRFTAAWYRRTPRPNLPPALAPGGMTDFVTEEIGAFLEGLWQTSDWFWVSHPNRVRIAERKIFQLRLARRLGFSIPQTVVTNDPGAATEFINSVPSAIVKTLSKSGADIDGAGWSLFAHSIVSKDLSPKLSVQIAPCIFQERIVRKADIRVTVVGDKIFAAAISLCGKSRADDVDWRAASADDLHYELHRLPAITARLCRRMLKQLGLRYGCFDFLLTPDGRYVFLEVNPSGQWGWIEHEIGVPITNAIARLLIECEGRES